MNNMTKEQALQVLIQFEQVFVGSGRDHDAIREAIRVLADEPGPESAPPAPKPEPPKK